VNGGGQFFDYFYWRHNINILVNAIGVQDSGGITVLEKSLSEFELDSKNNYFVVCSGNANIVAVIKKYRNINFDLVNLKFFLYRLYYENINFRNIITNEHIDLIYNFSGTFQFFCKVPQLTKVQNLLFFSKKLDETYIKNSKFTLWFKQVYLKRIVLKLMMDSCVHLEVQSLHVKDCLSAFINVNNKNFYVRSDVSVSNNGFYKPRQYDFKKKINFLYIVGPHFEYTHKNFIEFTSVMLELYKKNIDFEINITLTKEQLTKSSIWSSSLNERTNFLGYISEAQKMQQLFCDNTILISTSIIETLGLHVIEGIKSGIIVVVPNEKYSRSVYGNNVFTYELFNVESLLNIILHIINSNIDFEDHILTLQNNLKDSENSKYKNIVDIFERVKNV